jgi:hypothetical protein
MICTTCGHTNQQGLKFCTMCGAPLNQKTCANGHAIPDGLTECPYCPRASARNKPTLVEFEEPVDPAQDQAKAADPVEPPAPQARPPTHTMWVGEESPMLAGDRDVSSPRRDNTPALIGFLVSFSNDPAGEFWPLRYGRTTLGRDADNTVSLALPDVSGSHAVITARQSRGMSRIWIEDSSTNGTLLNDEDIFNDKPTLTSGDVITLGSTKLRLMLLI